MPGAVEAAPSIFLYKNDLWLGTTSTDFS